MKLTISTLAFCFVFSNFIFSNFAFAEFKVPPLSGPVVDQANVMIYDDERVATQIIRELHNRGKAQLALVTLPTLDGLTIEQAGIQIADHWKLGSQKEDNGILLIAAVKERALRIEVGQGLEGTIPDAIANQIIEDVVVPTIRSSDLSKGLLTGVAAIVEKIDPSILSQTGQRKTRSHKGSWNGFGLIVLLFIVALFKLMGALPGNRYRRTSHWGSGLGGGGFGGGSFGGGFGGGGGGFSGGGASGRW